MFLRVGINLKRFLIVNKGIFLLMIMLLSIRGVKIKQSRCVAVPVGECTCENIEGRRRYDCAVIEGTRALPTARGC